MVTIEAGEDFSLQKIADSGQCFRWQRADSGIGPVCYRIPAFNRVLIVSQDKRRGEIRFDCSAEEFDSLWRAYFDLDTDYVSICEKISPDESIKKAVEMYYGIRILKQEPWEALCSFIISQNNNIPRIKGIIERLCENFGNEIEGGFTFPDASTLAKLEPEDLAPLRAGFRAKYIIDAARKVSNGEVDFDKIKNSPIEFGREELQKICGVGAKVAECTLLYGFYKVDAFPIDVWVKRIMAEMYPDGLPEIFKGNEGIAQQYLFDYARRKIGDGNG